MTPTLPGGGCGADRRGPGGVSSRSLVPVETGTFYRR